MATKEANLRVVLEHANDAGEVAEKVLDTNMIDGLPLILKGYTQLTPGERISLAPAAADQAVTFTGVIGLIIVSHDYSFKLRHAAGQALLSNLRVYVIFAEDTLEAAHTTSVLLTGNGTYAADIEVWKIEKPT